MNILNVYIMVALSSNRKAKGTIKSKYGVLLPSHILSGKNDQSNIQSFLGGNIPLKYIINYTSKESSHYPYLLNL